MVRVSVVGRRGLVHEFLERVTAKENMLVRMKAFGCKDLEFLFGLHPASDVSVVLFDENDYPMFDHFLKFLAQVEDKRVIVIGVCPNPDARVNIFGMLGFPLFLVESLDQIEENALVSAILRYFLPKKVRQEPEQIEILDYQVSVLSTP